MASCEANMTWPFGNMTPEEGRHAASEREKSLISVHEKRDEGEKKEENLLTLLRKLINL